MVTNEYSRHDLQMSERLSRVEEKIDQIGERLDDYFRAARATEQEQRQQLHDHAKRIERIDTRSKFWGWLALIAGALTGFFSPWRSGR